MPKQTLGFLAIKCIGRKLRAINKLIGPDIQFKLDEISGIIYAFCTWDMWSINEEGQKEPGSNVYTFYMDSIPKNLMNVLLRRKIVLASAKFNYSIGSHYLINLTCNDRNYVLNQVGVVPGKWVEDPYLIYTTPCCVYPVNEQLYMGVSTNSMFIGDVMYSSRSRYGLYKVKYPNGKTSIVSLEVGGPKVIEGIKTTMSTENYEKFNSGTVLGRDDFRAYGLHFDEPEFSWGPSSSYPLFFPLIPGEAYENNMSQLVVNYYTFNEELNFSSVVFHKNKDWPIELIHGDGSSSRYNVIMACCFVSGGYSGSYQYIPHLVDTNNRASAFYWSERRGGQVPDFNKYGEITEIARYKYVKRAAPIPIDMNIIKTFSTALTSFNWIAKDAAGNYYGCIYKKYGNKDEDGNYIDFNPELDIMNGSRIIKRLYLKNSAALRTKPALHTIEE